MSYGINAAGQSFGPQTYSAVLGYEADLVSVIGASGVSGYARRDDLLVPIATTPEEALTVYAVQQVKTIPVYDSDGVTVLDSFSMTYGGIY